MVVILEGHYSKQIDMRWMQSCSLFLTILLSFTGSFAQPATEIYLFDLQQKKGKMVISNPVNISNHRGYDNQPFFHPDQTKLYYVSADSAGRTDIMVYDYQTRQTTALTRTSEKEYSPTVTPDKQFISCIVQRDDGKQDLAKYPVEGGAAQVLIDNLTVGYHAWVNNDEVAVFALPKPFTLHVINLRLPSNLIITDSIGRSLHKVPRENAISFVQQVISGEWFIKKWNPETKQVSVVTKSLSATEHDMAWTPSRKIIMSDEKKLYFFDTVKKSGWKEVTVTGWPLPGAITRLAVNATGNKVAIVISE